MSLESSILSNMDDVTKDFIENLMLLNRQFYEQLREYTINVIGSGNLGIPYVLHMASILARPNSTIKTINWITREYEDKNKDLKTGILNKIIDDEFSHNVSNRQGNNSWIYEKIKSNVNIKGYTNIAELKEIIRESVNPDIKKHGNLTVILTDYDTSILFNKFEGKNPKENIFVPKTRAELKSMGESEILLNARTLSYESLHGFNECIESLIETQQRIDTIKKTVEKFCSTTGITPSRYSLLPQSIIGNMAIAKAFEGYTGTVINMTNPNEEITQQFAFHSRMPVNRIFASIENDYCRLNIIIRNVYHEIFGNHFKGKLAIPTIYGPHNEWMESERESILFDGIPFDKVFQRHKADELFDKIKINWRNYGTVHKLKYGVVCPDTVPNSLIPASLMIVNEQDSEVMRGCIYDKEYGIFTGGDFKLQIGHVIQESSQNIERLPIPIRKKIIKGIGLDRHLTEELSEIDGLTGLVLEGPAKIPDASQVHKVHKISAEEYVTDITKKTILPELQEIKKDIEVLKNGKDKTSDVMFPQLNFSVYTRPLDNSRIVKRHIFTGEAGPVTKEYQFIIPGSNVSDSFHELERTKIKNFGIYADSLVMLAVRQRKDKSKTFYINGYDINNKNTLEYSRIFSYNPNEGILSMVLSDRIYLLVNESKRQHISIFNPKKGNIEELCNTDNLSGIIPYSGSILGFTKDRYFKFNGANRLDLIYQSKVSNNGKIYVDSINNILYYVARDDSDIKEYSMTKEHHVQKEIIAQDLNNDISRTFKSDPNGFGVYSDSGGIQIWTTLDDTVRLLNFKNKQDVFKDGLNSISSRNISLRQHHIQTIRRDMAIMYNDSKAYILIPGTSDIQLV
ncbi:MAG: hypothetical protein ACP5OA_06730, partial [Candidatus Woesearchaeota archaeon]